MAFNTASNTSVVLDLQGYVLTIPPFDPRNPNAWIDAIIAEFTDKSLAVTSWEIDSSAFGLLSVTIEYVEGAGGMQRKLILDLGTPQFGAGPFTHSFSTIQPVHVPLDDLGVVVGEPYVGYRDFEIIGPIDVCTLASRNGEEWPTREPLIARCKYAEYNESNVNWLTLHDAPDETCQCGIYAFNSPDNPELEDDAIAWAEVNLWGKILVAPHGYRAEFSYPKTIFIRDTGTKMVRYARERLEKEYGVPAILVDIRERMPLSTQLDAWLTETLEGGDNDNSDT